MGGLSLLSLWLTTASSFLGTVAEGMDECQTETNRAYAENRMNTILTLWDSIRIRTDQVLREWRTDLVSPALFNMAPPLNYNALDANFSIIVGETSAYSNVAEKEQVQQAIVDYLYKIRNNKRMPLPTEMKSHPPPSATSVETT